MRWYLGCYRIYEIDLSIFDFINSNRVYVFPIMGNHIVAVWVCQVHFISGFHWEGYECISGSKLLSYIYFFLFVLTNILTCRVYMYITSFSKAQIVYQLRLCWHQYQFVIARITEESEISDCSISRVDVKGSDSFTLTRFWIV